MPVINNVTFFYTKIASPVPNFDKTGNEWCVDVVLSKTDAKAFKKEFKKASIKEFDNDEFLEKFKVKEVPFPEQDEQFVLKIKKAAQFKDGNVVKPEHYPRVFLQTEDGNIDITQQKAVGNGSKGALSYRVKTNDYGSFADLSAILVTDLVEYVGSGGGVVGSEFGVTSVKPLETREAVTKQEEALPESKPAKATKPTKVEDESEDCPF